MSESFWATLEEIKKNKAAMAANEEKMVAIRRQILENNQKMGDLYWRWLRAVLVLVSIWAVAMFVIGILALTT